MPSWVRRQPGTPARQGTMPWHQQGQGEGSGLLGPKQDFSPCRHCCPHHLHHQRRPLPRGGTGLPTPRPPGELFLSHQISAFLGGALKVVIHEVQGLFLLSAFQAFPVHDLSQDERPPDTKISQPFTQFSPVARAPSPKPTEYTCLTNLVGTTSRERRRYSR